MVRGVRTIFGNETGLIIGGFALSGRDHNITNKRLVTGEAVITGLRGRDDHQLAVTKKGRELGEPLPDEHDIMRRKPRKDKGVRSDKGVKK